jgi:hypothetical protein
VTGCRAWLHYAYCVRHAALRAFGEWLLTALVAFVIMEIAAQVLPGHRLTLPVIAASIGAGHPGQAVLLTGEGRAAPCPLPPSARRRLALLAGSPLAVVGDALQDLVGRPGPHEGLRVLVPLVDPLADIGQPGDAAVR